MCEGIFNATRCALPCIMRMRVATSNGSIRLLLKQMDGLRVYCARRALFQAWGGLPVIPEVESKIYLMHTIPSGPSAEKLRFSLQHASAISESADYFVDIHKVVWICWFLWKSTIETVTLFTSIRTIWTIDIGELDFICKRIGCARNARSLCLSADNGVTDEKVKSLISSISRAWISSWCTLHV